MKTVFLSSAIALSALAQWPLLFASDVEDQTQPFSAAPQIAIQILDK
ncbi:hypothetical protein [uncultured Roseovarius sp.]|nr:hypothetical protein [uncultured Roseovarius sp.]